MISWGGVVLLRRAAEHFPYWQTALNGPPVRRRSGAAGVGTERAAANVWRTFENDIIVVLISDT
jgi:hypothetical protein